MMVNYDGYSRGRVVMTGIVMTGIVMTGIVIPGMVHPGSYIEEHD